MQAILMPKLFKIACISQNLNLLNMAFQPKCKRPTCPNCSKPLIVCLCTRLQTRKLENNIHVTILQHSLEVKHPLNSARIAKLGLNNVGVFVVSDVNFKARFDIWPLGRCCDSGFVDGECTPSVCGNACESLRFDEGGEGKMCRKRDFGQVGEVGLGVGSVLDSGSKRFSDGIAGIEGSGGISDEGDDRLLKEFGVDDVRSDDSVGNSCGDEISNVSNRRKDEPLLSVVIGKSGKISSVSHQWKLTDESKTPKIEHLFDSAEAVERLAGGFVVKKLQKREKNGSVDLEQFEEFEITVPPGTALLFPSENAVAVDAIDFQVKNLIVLDGTWSKAKRMYLENPWLRILPSVRLDVEKLSLFSEVRRQPKPGYLSTIESIVYALKALGEAENLPGLENLLGVFESMVKDQRRYKDENLAKLSST
ncbi:hypothetical protein RND81_12G198800 [Saponaria officinalis]|uniref:tRNA-uridine aminocarboxypropyltransferase n=1 Tax=Saponaria officinalis TaxID=3572 RepID=A0AAW1HCZ5_SAPOF